MKSPTGGLRAGEFATLAGVSTDTLRHYERKGLIPAAPRTPNGYRVYARDTLNRVRMIRSALCLGFSIDDLARVFQVRAAGGVPCREVRSLAASKLREVRERQKELAKMATMLTSVIRDWDRRLRSNSGPAHLLQTLSTGELGGRRASTFGSPRRLNQRKGR